MVFGPHDATDAKGTEDPRVAYDSNTGVYYMMYTCWGDQAQLCLASTRDPTRPDGWTRHGLAFPGEHKSGALLIREQPPHYLISGAGSIYISKSDNLLNWTLGDLFINGTLWYANPPPHM